MGQRRGEGLAQGAQAGVEGMLRVGAESVLKVPLSRGWGGEVCGPGLNLGSSDYQPLECP